MGATLLQALPAAGKAMKRHPRIAAKNSVHSSGLFLIGGAADTSLKDFLHLAGGKRAQVVIVPHASGEPKESALDVVSKLSAIEPDAKLRVVLPGETFALGADDTAVYMAGGDQVRLVKELGAEGGDALKRFLRRGGLVGGTSAGAMSMAKNMIAGGMNEPGSQLETGHGFGLMPGFVVDTHFGNRGRFPRIHVALGKYPQCSALGLDEDTAVHVNNGCMTVYGAGVVWLYEPAHGAVRRRKYAACLVTPMVAGEVRCE